MTTRNAQTGRFESNTIFDEGFFDDVNSEVKAYWLGFLFADGNIKDNGVLQLAISSKDISHLCRFIDALNSNARIYQYTKRDEYKARIINSVHHRSRHMASSLLRYGFHPRKTKTATVPNLPLELQSHFFRGYFDGDGSVFSSTHKNSTKLSMNVIGNIEFASQMQQLLITHVGVNQTKLNIPKHSPDMAYVIYSGTPQVKRIARWMYDNATIWLPRKRERFQID